MTVAGEGYSVDLNHLDEVTARLQAFKAFLTAHLDTLDAKAREVVASWTGEVATAYAVAHNEWVAGATDVREGLQVLETAAGTAHGNYSSALATNMSRLGL
ncbi:WXG100 family type VII secretion target [Nocardia huaxiensis]|uniref:WXG100 family type VII secretion target n=1 Tax=Nocardia huaxiensis TaxID=2755382 RepID=A0A7D6VH40_9NOCA|nr:WXG100 family type VII secretion target [Nocardia huaxiensis]QLY29936.1 WXG100 family type VII secretion target [Nocardia huaxiensis]UFS96479.1 WXG100 family type VII secretion target [Nocardia huaxiensis]